MEITDELIAAYIDGNVTVKERQEVRRYLAVHPEERDLVLILMEGVENYSDEVENTTTATLRQEQSFTDIAYATAAFAPRKFVRQESNPKVSMNRPQERYLRMSALWNELQENE